MMYDDLINLSQIKDNIDSPAINEDGFELIEVIGLEAYIELVKAFGGDRLYIQKFDAIVLPLIHQLIVEEYKKYVPIKTLIRKYSISAEGIRRIVKNETEK